MADEFRERGCEVRQAGIEFTDKRWGERVHAAPPAPRRPRHRRDVAGALLRQRREPGALPQGEDPNSQLLFAGMGRLSENSRLNTKNKSHSVTAELQVPDGGAEGVIVAQGGAYAGWSLYVKNGKPKYCYNL